MSKPKTTAKPKKRRAATKRSAVALRRHGSVSEDRILQLSNDASEGIKSGNALEWRAVALYFRQKFDDASNDLERVQAAVASMTIGHDLVMMAAPELKSWLNSRKKLNTQAEP